MLTVHIKAEFKAHVCRSDAILYQRPAGIHCPLIRFALKMLLRMRTRFAGEFGNLLAMNPISHGIIAQEGQMQLRTLYAISRS